MKPIHITVLIISLIYHYGAIKAQNLETIYINELVSTHFITSEPIEYVDISTDDISGDLPVSNILRLKPQKTDSTQNIDMGILTIVCQKFMVQYALKGTDIKAATKSVFISSLDGQGLLLPEVIISAEEIKEISKKVLNQKAKKPIHQTKAQGLKMKLNKVYVQGDYYFLDLSIHNKSHIAYEIDQLLFSVCDKKVIKATNHQEIPLEPVFKLYTQKRIRSTYRNIIVLRKFTFPNEKMFRIRLTEKQLSGRSIELEIDYKKIQDTEPI